MHGGWSAVRVGATEQRIRDRDSSFARDHPFRGVRHLSRQNADVDKRDGHASVSIVEDQRLREQGVVDVATPPFDKPACE
jgi:hypothetical protein